MKHRISNKMFRIFSIVLALSVLISLFSPVLPARAGDDPFTLPDRDNDGISNQLETGGWYNLAGGPFVTDPNDQDTDNDGLTDGQEKLFNTNPLDSHSPGIAVRYENSFKTKQYFSTTDPAYLPMTQGGDQYLMTQAMVIRRGTTFNIIGPATGTISITGSGLTTLIPVQDPARGGWMVTVPADGTVGTYTGSISDGTWSKSFPLYVLFELPTDLSPADVSAFAYDDDPANKKDEVAVWFIAPENRLTPDPTCTDPNTPCSLWSYRKTTGNAQAFWTEQFKKKVFVNSTIVAINGVSSQSAAAQHIADWADREFRVNYSSWAADWTNAMYTWNDGTGQTMNGGGCETNANVFVSMLRSAGIPARTYLVDYSQKSCGEHGEQDWLCYNVDEYDNSAMMWMDHTWKAERNYGGSEWQYYGNITDPVNPRTGWASGTTGVLNTLNSGGNYYYNDYYGDFLETGGAGWDWQNGSNGGGMVNTIWPIPPAEYNAINRDVEWLSKSPLEITQSPYVEILACQVWKGDGWAPSEWQNPPGSNPNGRNASQTYVLPAGIPDPANPLENWPYNPKPIACSPSTPTDVCNAFKASWTASCPAIPGSLSIIPTYTTFVPLVINHTSGQAPEVQLGDITADYGKDLNGDGRFDELTIEFNVTSSMAGDYQLGGYIQVGENALRSSTARIALEQGEQSVQITFDGQQIGDDALDGPYQVKALWVAKAGQSVIIIDPDKMLDYQEYAYSTQAYTADQFMIQPAAIAEGITHQGVDADGNGLYDSVLVNVPLTINLPGNFTLDGTLYDNQGAFVAKASWTGSESNAVCNLILPAHNHPTPLSN